MSSSLLSCAAESVDVLLLPLPLLLPLDDPVPVDGDDGAEAVTAGVLGVLNDTGDTRGTDGEKSDPMSL